MKHSIFRKIIISALYLFIPGLIYAQENALPFDAYLSQFAYPGIIQKISPLERTELNRISFTGGGARRGGRRGHKWG
ncbi:MAG: hypothetical protein ACRCUT_10200 [Spirochaetota bacterium]